MDECILAYKLWIKIFLDGVIQENGENFYFRLIPQKIITKFSLNLTNPILAHFANVRKYKYFLCHFLGPYGSLNSSSVSGKTNEQILRSELHANRWTDTPFIENHGE